MSPRLLITFAAMAMAGSALPALAKQAEPEVTLHIEAAAQVEPDQVFLPLTIQGSGKTKAQAEADLAKRDGDFIARLKAMGIDPSKAKPFDDGDDTAVAASPAGEAACEAAMAAAAAADGPRKGRKATAVIGNPCADEGIELAAKGYLVELKDGGQAELLLSDFAGDRSYSVRRKIRYAQSDPTGARKKARDQAIAKAQAEAEAYAGSLGFRVVRIVKVSNARPGINLNEVIGFISAIEDRGSRMQPSWFAAVLTENVAIDFVIAPK